MTNPPEIRFSMRWAWMSSIFVDRFVARCDSGSACRLASLLRTGDAVIEARPERVALTQGRRVVLSACVCG